MNSANIKFIKYDIIRRYKKERNNDICKEEFFGRCNDVITDMLREFEERIESVTSRNIDISEINVSIFFGDEGGPNLFCGTFKHSQIMLIKKAIYEAEKQVDIDEDERQKKIIEPKDQIVENKSEPKQINNWTTPVFALFLYFLKEGGYKERITKKYLTELSEEFNYSKDIEILNNSIIAINKCSEKDPFDEINLLNIITLFTKDYICYPKSKSLALRALTDYQPKPMR